MPQDIAKILLKDGKKTTVLTDDFAKRLVNLIRPLFDIRVFDKTGKRFNVIYGDSVVAAQIDATATTATTETPVAGGMFFRGEWTASPLDGSSQPAPYKVGHVVVVRGGSYAGTYVCVKDNPNATQQPPNGVYWVSLSQTSAIGLWT